MQFVLCQSVAQLAGVRRERRIIHIKHWKHGVGGIMCSLQQTHKIGDKLIARNQDLGHNEIEEWGKQKI